MPDIRNLPGRLRSKVMPTGSKLAQMAQEELKREKAQLGLDPFAPSYLRAHCDEVLVALLDTEFKLFQKEEQLVKAEQLGKILKEAFPSSEHFTGEQVKEIIKEKFDQLSDFFKSTLQSRLTRAGGSLQNHIAYILAVLGYPCEAQKEINGKPDFILPNAAVYHKNPAECILITAKRTLRERWRQIIIEGFRSPQYFLVTRDDKITQTHLDEMSRYRIYLVVPEPIRSAIPRYKDSANVISFLTFLSNYLDPAMARWRQAGIVP